MVERVVADIVEIAAGAGVGGICNLIVNADKPSFGLKIVSERFCWRVAGVTANVADGRDVSFFRAGGSRFAQGKSVPLRRNAVGTEMIPAFAVVVGVSFLSAGRWMYLLLQVVTCGCDVGSAIYIIAIVAGYSGYSLTFVGWWDRGFGGERVVAVSVDEADDRCRGKCSQSEDDGP